jgi:hypothetical protein
MAEISATATPVPFNRCATVRGPMPASISITPPGVRTTLQFPDEPLANTQSSMDIRVVSGKSGEVEVLHRVVR